MRHPRKLRTILALLLAGSALIACDRRGPAEETGKKVDEATEEAREKTRRGPAEKTGKEIDEAAEEARRKAREAQEEIEKKRD